VCLWFSTDLLCLRLWFFSLPRRRGRSGKGCEQRGSREDGVGEPDALCKESKRREHDTESVTKERKKRSMLDRVLSTFFFFMELN
jgi:hypothetical protein